MPNKIKFLVVVLTVLCISVCAVVPAFATETTTESTETTTEDMNLWDYFKNFFESIDLTPVLDFLSSAWDGVTNFFGLFDAVSDDDGPFGWLD